MEKRGILLNKQDLMRLPKERLAEIIVEMQEEKSLTLTTPDKDVPHFIPFQTQHPYCWEPGGVCINPQMDCINCPRTSSSKPFVYTGPHIDTYISGDANSTDNDEIHAYGNSKDNKGYQPSGKNKELCIYNDGDFCKKGLPGTQCDVVGCVAYKEK